MRLTLHADYSLRVLVYLAIHQDRLVSTAEISQAYDISRNHLVRVVLALGKKGFVKVRPGRSGGVTLAKAVTEITIGAVVRAMEPDFHIVECFDERRNRCPITPVCGLKGILYEAQKAFLTTLDRYTLADFVTQPQDPQFLIYLPPPGAMRSIN
jgi:Rrf2 family transcriptional regulator, nitric oxide-sensitive transcriptional repressor